MREVKAVDAAEPLEGKDLPVEGPVAVLEIPEAAAAAPTRSRRRRLVALGVVAVVLLAAVAGGLVAWDRHQTAVKVVAALSDAAESAAAWATGDAELEISVGEARTLLTEAEGKVAEAPVLDVLAGVIEDAAAIANDDAPVVPNAGDVGLDEARQAAREAAAAVDAQQRAATDLASAVDDVKDARAAYDQAVAIEAEVASARQQTEAVVAAGEKALTESEGRLLDNAVRHPLREALDAAIALVATDVDTADLGAVMSTKTALREARTAVETAATAVTEAQTKWQEEEDRKAAATPPPTTQGGNKTTQTPRGSQPQKETATPAASKEPTGPKDTAVQPPAGTSDPGTSGGNSGGSIDDKLDDPFGDGTLGTCFDTKGNSWPC